MTAPANEVIRVAARGDGITSDGQHAPLAAPGDTIAPDGVVTRGPRHQPPACSHFPACGGCQLQHLDDAAYADFLTDRIAGALAAHDMTAAIRAPILSPPRTRRRATLHAERRGRQVHLGFTEGGSHRLVDVQDCAVLHPDLHRLLTPLRSLLAAYLPATRRVDVHLALADQGIDALVQGVAGDSLSAAEAITGFARRHGLARLSVDDGMGPETRWEPDAVTVTLGGVPVGLPAGAFLQATREGEATLIDSVRGIVGDARAVADLFAGLGTFTFAMAPGVKVYAAEAARDAILCLKSAAGMAQRPVFADHRDLYRRPVTTADLDRFDALILDPPRAGAKEQAAQIAASRVSRVAYVSCNPSSFARDAKLMCDGGHHLLWVQPVGQFRWSTHVELVAAFAR